MSKYYYYAIKTDKLSKKDYQHINNSFSLDNDLTIKFFPNLKALIEGIYIYRLDKLIGI